MPLRRDGGHGRFDGFVLQSQRGQGLPGTHFEEDHPGLLLRLAQSPAEQHGLADLADPVHGVLDLTRSEPPAGHGRKEGRARGVPLHALDHAPERLQRGRHHVGMEGVRRLEQPATDALRFQLAVQLLEGRHRTGEHAHRRRIGGGQRYFLSEERLHLLLGHTHREHATRRQGLHELRALHNHLQGIGETEHT